MTSNSAISDEQLVETAREAMKRAYAPYSKFHVAAALVTGEGAVFTGVNIENASYGLTVCAERVALFKAVSEGERAIARIAVVSSAENATYPCGACLQALKEFSADATVILEDNSGRLVKHKLSELLPHSFGRESLISE